MSGEIDEEIERLVKKNAEEFDLPPELLMEIYTAEQRVVNMERRGRIYKRVHEILEQHLDSEK
jgi:hypothetical protein